MCFLSVSKNRLCCSLLLAATVFQLHGCAVLIGGGVAAGGATMLHDRRGSSGVFTDEGIELKISGKINNTANLKESTHVNITSYNQIVLLTGEAPDAGTRAQIIELARSVEGIKHLHNDIQIASTSSFRQRSEDTLITAKAKTALFSIDGLPGFDSSRVKVVTERQVVYLMGLLHHSEAEAVTDAVRQVKDVKQVVKIFEYID